MTCGADLQRIFMFILGFNKNPGKNKKNIYKVKNQRIPERHTACVAGAGLAQLLIPTHIHTRAPTHTHMGNILAFVIIRRRPAPWKQLAWWRKLEPKKEKP